MPVTVHYLLIYDHRHQILVEQPREFRDGAAAATAYADAERTHRHEPDLEIVLVGADSIDTVMRTHGHYFSTSAATAAHRFLVPIGHGA